MKLLENAHVVELYGLGMLGQELLYAGGENILLMIVYLIIQKIIW